jgi:hypothetical protein
MAGSVTYVVAGNHEQAYQYINRKIEERVRNGEEVSKINDYSYVRDVTTLRGVSNPKGVFIGSWKERKDIKDIVQQLMVSQTHVNPVLIKIWKEVRNEPSNAAPIQPSQGILRGAEMLAQAIDEEVLAQALKKINGGDLNG